MKDEVNPLVIGAVIVLLLGMIGGAMWYYTTPRVPAGVKYKPGVPPWQDPDYKGPGWGPQGAKK
jgi:hypothetical protein